VYNRELSRISNGKDKVLRREHNPKGINKVECRDRHPTKAKVGPGAMEE
jgi:hypothetical protein